MKKIIKKIDKIYKKCLKIFNVLNGIYTQSIQLLNKFKKGSFLYKLIYIIIIMVLLVKLWVNSKMLNISI